MATLKDIAEEAGLSTMTVSNILNGKTKEKWSHVKERADKVREIATRMGYKANSAARAMRSQSTRHIGVVFLHAGHQRQFYLNGYEFISSINCELQKMDYLLSIVRFDDLSQEESRGRFQNEKIFDGVICLAIINSKSFRFIEKTFLNCVWLESNNFGGHNCMRRDEVSVGELAARTLIESGCDRIAWCRPYGGDDHFSIPERELGIKTACGSQVELMTYFHHRPSNQAKVATMDDLLENLDRKIGVVAQSPQTAWRFFVQSAQKGLLPGKDYSLICCDDTCEQISTWPELSRISFNRHDYGIQAVKMLFQLLKGGKPISLKIKDSLIVGETIIQ